MRVVDTSNDESSTASLTVEVTPGKTTPILHAIKITPNYNKDNYKWQIMVLFGCPGFQQTVWVKDVWISLSRVQPNPFSFQAIE